MFLFYYKTNEVISLKNHVDANHVVLYKKMKEEVNNFERKCGETSQRNVQTYLGHQFDFFVAKTPYKQCDVDVE